MLRICLLVAMAAAAMAAPAGAHVTSTGLAVLTADGEALDYRLTLVLAELPEGPARRLADGAAGDRAAAEEAAAWLRQHVVVTSGGEACRPGRIALQASAVGDGRVVLSMALRCTQAPGRIGIRDGWHTLFGPHYRSIVSVRGAAGGGELVLQEEAREASFDLGAPATRFGGFLTMGIAHILTGLDHLLFLGALLLAARSVLSILATVTAFTLAHSVTLSLAALGLVDLPAAVIEPLIAASIIWVAAENLFGAEGAGRRIAVTFLFGLVHGLGFAEVLRALDLEGWRLVTGLAGFNLGVEAGQAAVVVLVAPLLLWARGRSWGPRFRWAASIGLVLIGAFWLVERIVDGVT